MDPAVEFRINFVMKTNMLTTREETNGRGLLNDMCSAQS